MLGSCRALAKKALATLDIHDERRLAVPAPELELCRLCLWPDDLACPQFAGRANHISVPHDKFTTIPFFRQRFSLPCVYCSTRFQDRSRACACARERQPLRSPLGRCSWRSCRRRNRSPAGSSGPREPGTGCQWRRSRPSTAPAAGAGPTDCGNSSTAADRWE